MSPTRSAAPTTSPSPSTTRLDRDVVGSRRRPRQSQKRTVTAIVPAPKVFKDPRGTVAMTTLVTIVPADSTATRLQSHQSLNDSSRRAFLWALCTAAGVRGGGTVSASATLQASLHLPGDRRA